MRSRVTARTDPPLHSTAMLSTTTSTQQYISGARRLIWVVVCHKNTMRKVAQAVDMLGNYKIETKRPKIRRRNRATGEGVQHFTRQSRSGRHCNRRSAYPGKTHHLWLSPVLKTRGADELMLWNVSDASGRCARNSLPRVVFSVLARVTGPNAWPTPNGSQLSGSVFQYVPVIRGKPSSPRAR